MGAGASGGKLTLIDSDIFQEENIGRHALGKAYLHRMKASALKQEIAQQIPDLNIEVHNINACNRSILKIFQTMILLSMLLPK
ncbi:ThiF family adenylyltransferase [Psychrobacter sp. KH172YL61]|uniref:ThiF family adenylyltransferase n=1 Tax=Psychrobacter sp. KH172YL61 TaxID=2517899 RepID=UPI003FA686F3